jgi:hypothetical protein
MVYTVDGFLVLHPASVVTAYTSGKRLVIEWASHAFKGHAYLN